MNDNYLKNIPSMSAGEVVERFSSAYSHLINRNCLVKTMPTVMLYGPPGVGKSQAVRQIAGRIEEETGKRVSVTDVRLMLFNPIDLRGIPTANEDKTLAVWLKPKIFQMDPSEECVNILFLDEITAAPQSVQAAAYQITLDRTVGEHRLPDNCIVIAAGNRITDKSVFFKLPKALCNRMMSIEVKPDYDSWHQWAASHGINGKVLGFLTFRPDYLMRFDATSDDLAFATPRSWEMVSNILNEVNDSIADVFPMIAGLVGTGMAVEMRNWELVYQDLPDIKSIFQGKSPDLPKKTDALYALTASMFEYAKAHRDDLSLIENSIIYADRMPPDFSVILMKDYMYMEKDYRQKLMRIPAFTRWLNAKGRFLNAVM